MDKNSFICSGIVTFKRFSKRNGVDSLFIVLSIQMPRPPRRNGEVTGLFSDTPAFTITGEKAVELNRQFKVSDPVTIEGHIGVERVMQRVEGRMFRETFQTALFVDKLVKEQGATYCNTVMIEGKASWVYRNPAIGKQFYIITIDTTLPSGEKVRANVTYFDRRMELEPQRGDRISITGAIRVKHVEAEDNERETILTTVVANTAKLLDKVPRKNDDQPADTEKAAANDEDSEKAASDMVDTKADPASAPESGANEAAPEAPDKVEAPDDDDSDEGFIEL